MTTAATRMRRVLADRIATAYVDSGATAVLLGGSTGRSEADRYSDIEVGVFWADAPTDEQRAGAVARAGGDLHRLWPYSEADRAWFDDWFIGRRDGRAKSGVLVEPVHMTLADARLTVDDVVRRCDPALEKQVLLAALRDGVPLTHDAFLPALRAAAATYPDELARAVVDRFGQIDHFWRLPMFRERRNELRVAAATTDVHERVLHCLLAVNRMYWYGFKSLHSIAQRLPTAPANLVARIRGAYELHDDARDRVLGELVEETYDLVERHVPGVEIDRLRSIFRYRRELWEDELPELG